MFHPWLMLLNTSQSHVFVQNIYIILKSRHFVDKISVSVWCNEMPAVLCENQKYIKFTQEERMW